MPDPGQYEAQGLSSFSKFSFPFFRIFAMGNSDTNNKKETRE